MKILPKKSHAVPEFCNSSDRKRNPLHGLLALLLITFAAASPAEGTVIYRQNFGYTGNTPGSGTERSELSTVGWKNLVQQTNYNTTPATSYGISDTVNEYYAGVRNSQGSPIDLPNVGTPAESASNVYGVATLYRADAQSFKALMYADHFSINLQDWRLDDISWRSATTDASTGNILRAAIRIDGDWYISSSIFSPLLQNNKMENFSISAEARSAVMGVVNWYTLSAVMGNAFVEGTTPTLLPTSGVIDAFGMYATTANANGHTLMFDSYTIAATAIPEAGSIAMFGIGVIIALSVWRSRNMTVTP